MWQYLKARWQSLIFRLLFYFVISMLAVAVALAISFTRGLKPHFENEILPNVERYIEYLIDDIGIPPDLSVAQRLADELPFEIRIDGAGVEWTSSPRLKPISSYRFEPAPRPYDDVYFSQQRRNQYLLIRKQDYRYLFAIDNSFRRGSEQRHSLLLVFLGLILFLLYLAIRRMFRPIEAISQQVRNIGEGNLGQSIDASGKGELALLAAGINRMSAQIKSMLEGKSGLLLAISHELRSPLTRMRVNLELLEHSDQQQKLIDDVREMETLLAALLESEKLSSGHAPLSLGRYELLTLVEEVVTDHPCRDRIRTSLTPIEAEFDRLRIGLLVKNLIDNACHYSSVEDGLIEVRLRRDQQAAIIEVQDRGAGIGEEEIPRLTEAFYRPDSARQRATGGYGLGLYLCKLIIDAHRGHFTIESEPGRGTTVIVKLPL
ncbi:MAG: HAMP domain-containing histidine kinase [Gammaproteobacteria bacterium]|nr:HAMP domain-containing histidine kinase [Gammaproteobacteria bacterium]MDH3535995.1 HAMP domain-containing histidine kinase [Gammaproteobacteria bacterium]